MEVKDRDDARQLLREIDQLSESAVLMNDVLKRFKESGGKAKFLVNAGGIDTVTELNKDTAEIIMREIISSYNDDIKVNKSKLEVVLRNAIVTIN